MAEPAHSPHGCETRCRELLCPLSNLRVGDMLEPFHSLDPSEGTDVESVQPGRQGVVQGPGFSTVQEDRDDRGVVYSELGLSGDIAVSPQGSPEGLQDGGCQSSASVYLWFQVAGVEPRYLKVGTKWTRVSSN